ncbi:MAG: electron transfer flavoprotein subunit beta/FixA family protein [Desulfobacteraceae bacterium]
MQIIACIKSVVMAPPTEDMVRSEDLCELNPYDRPVLETALRLRNTHGGRVTVLSMGPDAARFGLQEALAMGVDQGVLVCDPALAGSDTLATSTALAAAIKRLAPFDLVLFGTRTSDSDTGQVGPQTAVLLGVPVVCQVHSITHQAGEIRVERTADGFMEIFEIALPAALTIHSGAVEPRDIGLSGIEAAFKEDRLTLWSLSDVGVSPEMVGNPGSATRVISMARAQQGRTCEFLEGEAEEKAEALITRLSDNGMIG